MVSEYFLPEKLSQGACQMEWVIFARDSWLFTLFEPLLAGGRLCPSGS
jgi:hypothetical protein